MPRAPMHRQGSCCRPARHACVHKLLPGCAGRWRPGWQAVCLPRGRGPTCADGSQKDDSRATDRRLDERDAARGAAWLQQEAGQQRGASKAGEALEEASKPPPGQRRRQLALCQPQVERPNPAGHTQTTERVRESQRRQEHPQAGATSCMRLASTAASAGTTSHHRPGVSALNRGPCCAACCAAGARRGRAGASCHSSSSCHDCCCSCGQD